MKKNFNVYIIAWAMFFALFNLIVFIIPSFPESDKYTLSFWIGYIFIAITFIGQALCAYMAFKADTMKKLFYNITLLRSSYAGLIVSFVVGGLCMLISALPYWVGILLCTIALAINLICIFKATATVSEVTRIDEKVKAQTFFIKSLTIDADTLMARAKSEEVRAECRKIYEAVRYSDPMSHDALSSVESQITVKFAELSNAVQADTAGAVAEIANELVILIGDRNKKCRLLK